MNPALVASPDEEIRIRFHEVLPHPDLESVREETIGVTLKGLDVAENVVPSAAVQPDRVVPQLVQNLIHLKHSWERLNQYSPSNASSLDSCHFLRLLKHTVPYLSFSALSREETEG